MVEGLLNLVFKESYGFSKIHMDFIETLQMFNISYFMFKSKHKCKRNLMIVNESFDRIVRISTESDGLFKIECRVKNPIDLQIIDMDCNGILRFL